MLSGHPMQPHFSLDGVDMTARTLSGCDESVPPSVGARASAAPAAEGPLALRILECLAIIGAPLAIVVFCVTAMIQFG